MNGEISFSRATDQIFAIKALIAFRLVVISFFLGVVFFFQEHYGTIQFPLPISLLIAATYLVSIIYLVMLQWGYHHNLFIYIQLVLDVVIETAIIYSTGGGVSPFTFLYIFTIIASAIVLERPASWVIASTSAILYGLLVNLEFYGVIHPLPLVAYMTNPGGQPFIFLTLLVHIASFYLVAFLSDYLGQRLRRLLLAYLSKSRDLTDLQAFHENVVAHMGSGFLALGMDKSIVSANQAAEEMLGYSAKNLMRQKLEKIFPLIEEKEILPDPGEEGDQVRRDEIVYTPKTGEEKFFSVTSSLFKISSGSVRGYIVVFHDITHIKKMEAAVNMSERLASIGRIAAGLAHEIRNPLGSISGSIQMLSSEMKTELSPQREKLMSIILRETERLNGIIGRLLSSSSSPGKKVGKVNLAGLINEALILFKNDTRYSKIVKTETELDTRLLAEADPESIKQVFWNLLINAAQAMPDGGTITIKMQPVFDGTVAEKCAIEFADSGGGIPEKERMKIFEPFYTTKNSGTGLGLSTVLKIVENHDGEIGVANGTNGGAVFTISLPIARIVRDG